MGFGWGNGMNECLIVGAGSSKTKAVTYSYLFSISANLHYPNANIIFAQDDPILDQILRKGVDGFLTQPVFTTPQKYKRYSDHYRCIEFDYRKFKNCGSLSSGLNAVVLAQFLGFSHIVLAGFNFDEKDANYDEMFKIVKGKSEYTFL
jgi:hypothetical protein